MSRAAWLSVVMFALGCAGTLAPDASGQPVPHRQITDTGVKASELPPMREFFTTARDWAAFWAEHAEGPPPDVDFTRESVAVVALGAQPNPGFDIRIVGARMAEGWLEICVDERRPQPGMGYAAVVVHPFDMAAIGHAGRAVRTRFVAC